MTLPKAICSHRVPPENAITLWGTRVAAGSQPNAARWWCATRAHFSPRSPNNEDGEQVIRIHRSGFGDRSPPRVDSLLHVLFELEFNCLQQTELFAGIDHSVFCLIGNRWLSLVMYVPCVRCGGFLGYFSTFLPLNVWSKQFVKRNLTFGLFWKIKIRWRCSYQCTVARSKFTSFFLYRLNKESDVPRHIHRFFSLGVGRFNSTL